METLLGLFEEGNAILKDLQQKIGFHIEMGRYVNWNESYNVLVSHMQYVAGKSQ